MIYVSCDWIIEDTYMIISTFTCLFIPSSVGFIKTECPNIWHTFINNSFIFLREYFFYGHKVTMSILISRGVSLS